jgi:predicted RND superfamily exporter protein
MRKMLRPCLFTTLSTGAGFLSFLSSEIPIVRLTGLFAAVGIGLAFVLTVLVLPAALSFLRAPRVTAGRQAQGVLVRTLKRLGPWTARHPRAILACSVVTVGIGLLGITQLSTETTNLLLLKDGHPLRASYDFIERNLTGLSNLEVIVEGERDALRTPALLEKLDRLSAKIAQEPGLTKTISLVDYVKEINRALHGDDPEYYKIPDTARAVAQSLLLYEFAGGDELRDYVSGDYSAGRLTALFRTMSSRESAALQARVLDYARQLELPIKVTGTIALLEAMEQKVTISQVRSLGIALLLIAGLMALLLRSWRLGLLSLVPNALPILLMFAVMGFAGIPLDAATSIVAGLALGIAVDDTIHYLTRFRRELRQAKSYREALIRTTRTVGRAIVFTSVILFAGFSVLLLGTFKGTIYFGLLIGLAMAFALVGDLVLLPALLLVLRPIPMREVTTGEPMPAPASMPLPLAAGDDTDPERSG